MVKPIIFSLLILFFFACTTELVKDNKSIEKITNFNDTISFFLPSRRFNICSFQHKDTMHYVAWLKKNDKIFIYSDRGQVIDSFDTPKLLGNKIGFTIANGKLFFLTDANEFCELDMKGNMLKRHNIKLPDNTILSCYYEFPLEVRDTLAFFYQYPNFVITDENKLKMYYKTNRETIFNIPKGYVVQNNSGNYPPEIFDNSYYCFNPIRTINNKGEIIYIYPQSPKIYIYNYLTGKTKIKEVQSKFFEKNSPFDFSQIFNYDYISRYLTENSRHTGIVYNTFDNKYYRILTKKEPYSNKDGTITRTVDKSFIIQVLNENMELEKEIEIPGKKLHWGSYIPIKGGLLFEAYKNILNPHSSIKTYVKIKI